jgi:hypothetical protein
MNAHCRPEPVGPVPARRVAPGPELAGSAHTPELAGSAHTPELAGSAHTPVLVGSAHTIDQAWQALTDGADALDVADAEAGVVDAIRDGRGNGVIWRADAGVVDADQVGRTPAGVVAVAAIMTWTGAAPAVTTRHLRAARRAIDMTATIAGRRKPSLTVRGLA